MKHVVYISLLLVACTSTNYTKAFSIKETFSQAWNFITFKKQTSETKKFNKKVPPRTKVSIHNIHGPIKVDTWDRNEILIEAEKSGVDKRCDNTFIEEKLTDASYTIATKVVSEVEKSCTVSYTALIPKNAIIYSVTTDNGDITVSNSTQTVSAVAKTGNITVAHSSGDVKIHTEYGNIKIDQISSNAKDSLVVSADCGNIDIIVPKTFNSAHIYATARRGKINSSIPITTTITTEFNRKAMAKLSKNISGTIGKGGTKDGAQIKLQTDRGNINITTA